jgi:hypothetical protein
MKENEKEILQTEQASENDGKKRKFNINDA